MKKIVLSLLLITGILVLAGCGNAVDFSKQDHIICKKTEENNNTITDTVMVFSYDKSEKLKDFQIESNIQYKQKQSKEATELIAKAMKLISQPLGVFLKTEVGENTFYYRFSGNIDTFETLIKKLNVDYKGESIQGNTKQEALQELTKDGYSCEDIQKK